MNATVIRTGDRPRLRIQLEGRQILPAAQGARVEGRGVAAAPRTEPKTIDIRINSETHSFAYWPVKWRNKKTRRVYTAYELHYHDGLKPRRLKRARLSDLRIEAEEIALRKTNGETARLQLTPADVASYLRARELAAKVNAPVELLVAEAVEARLARAARAKFVDKTCPQIVSEFLEQKDRELKRKKWYRQLRKMLERFADYYTGPLSNLRAHDLNAWLRSLKGGLVYRRHHRDAAAQLIRYAQGANYLPREWNELKLVDNPEPAPVKIRTWSSEQIVKLLARTHPNMIPFTVLQAFAGIRHEEMNPGEFDLAKRPLDWSDFDWERKLIHITEDTGKTGQDRIVPMEDNLIEWLKPYAKESGRVCDVSNTSNCLSRAKIRAELPHGRNEARNVLRKTWISARLAIVKNIGQVAEEAGNSVAKIKSNYRRPTSETQAKRLFGIFPTHADILQIPLGLK